MKTQKVTKKAARIVVFVLLLSVQSAFAAQNQNITLENRDLTHNLLFTASALFFSAGFISLFCLKLQDDYKTRTKHSKNHQIPVRAANNSGVRNHHS